MSNYNPQVYHFLNFVFALVVAVSATWFIIQGDRALRLGQFLEFVSPIALVAVLFWVLAKWRNSQAPHKEKDRYADIKLYLTYLDKLKFDLVMFALPVLVITIAFIVQKQIFLVDLLQAIAVYFAFYFFQHWLFKKK